MLLRYGYGTNTTLNQRLLESAAYIYGNGYQLYGPHSYLGSFVTPPGMTLDVGPILPTGQPTYITFGGTTTVYAEIPVIFGSSIDVKMGMETFTSIGNGNGTMSSLFDNTATITGVQVFDNGGNAVNDFTIGTGSGTVFDANGVHLGGAAAAPEPTSLALVLFSFGSVTGGFAVFARRR